MTVFPVSAEVSMPMEPKNRASAIVPSAKIGVTSQLCSFIYVANTQINKAAIPTEYTARIRWTFAVLQYLEDTRSSISSFCSG